jgi:predicted SAM-dependent methyltransferase
MKILDVGCGTKKKKGAIGIDFNSQTDADVIHNLEIFPYPFNDNEFDKIYCDNVIEHLNDVIRTMEELWRISKPGGTIEIVVPYFRSKYAAIDPTHKHSFTVESLSYFDPNHHFFQRYKYSDKRLIVENVSFDVGYEHKSFLMKKFVKFCNKHIHFYEAYLSQHIALNSLTFTLNVVK